MVVESLLSFIALGLSPPTPSWGSILADGRQYMMLDPWMALLPGFAIIITVLAIGLAADGFADVLDPKLTQGAFQREPLATAGADRTPALPAHERDAAAGARSDRRLPRPRPERCTRSATFRSTSRRPRWSASSGRAARANRRLDWRSSSSSTRRAG